MVENIKEIIEKTSRNMFITYGYQKVTMREIAEACGISVGNLTYHYPHKEDLLMLEHDWLMNAFLNEVLKGENEPSGARGYFTVECAFLHSILNNAAISRLYLQVINVPNLRQRYCRAHHRLCQHFFPGTSDTGAQWNATVAMSALEFELADEKILENDFPDIMEKIFNTRLLFAGMNPAEYARDISDGVKAGITLSAGLRIL